ncbi:hypothetical protein NUW58_g9536 [Xylaria curta]|uniref:Uncharacterized protein n=1 Tax=Xylaria curta TaxID=42375 RepID=A0ACC1MXN6_9PEZI|nr:hypothetical protein NUW58_g9536 [Xylaria curta]
MLCNTEPQTKSDFNPKSVKRVTDIFDDPKFYVNGPSANDVRQGRDGDCWLLAALCTLTNKPSLIQQVCVARDEQVGVYGFVFHRDGEWISEIIDDKLFLTKPDFDESIDERLMWEDRDRVDSEEQYRKVYQSGSGALYFAQCVHGNETWLPLLEKAYAKAHGDYQAIEGGFTGEGIEDLTGGVTTELYSADILDKEYFWKEELLKVNDEFLFGCATGLWGGAWGKRKGIIEGHAYSIIKAVEAGGHRLVMLRNPWGKIEWRGKWSDGSKEWTAEWMTKLGHRFGDDGNFWISYEDLLNKYQAFDRTRLFTKNWKVTSMWTTVSVPWTLDYHDTYFAFSLAKPSPVVIVLSQLDTRYYRGLEGQYRFELNFRLHKKGQEDYVVRSISPYCQTRSVNVELELEAGEYTVLIKVNATRNLDILPIEQVIRNSARERRDKLVAVGMSVTHGKGKLIETEEEKEAKRAAEKRQEDKERAEATKKVLENRRDDYYMNQLDQKRSKAPTVKANKAALAAKNLNTREKAEDASEPQVSQEKPSDAKTEEHGQTVKLSGSDEPVLKASGDHAGPEVATGTTAFAQSEIKDDAKPSPGPEEGPSSEAKSGSYTVENSGASPSKEESKIPNSAEAQTRSVEEVGDLDDLDDSDDSAFSELPEIGSRQKERAEILWKRREPPVVPPQPAEKEDEEEKEDEFESNPWNAVATVGLRVYYRVEDERDEKEELVKLRVVRPNPYTKDQGSDGKEDPRWSGGGETDDLKEGSPKGLDVDDSAKE